MLFVIETCGQIDAFYVGYSHGWGADNGLQTPFFHLEGFNAFPYHSVRLTGMHIDTAEHWGTAAPITV